MPALPAALAPGVSAFDTHHSVARYWAASRWCSPTGLAFDEPNGVTRRASGLPGHRYHTFARPGSLERSR